MSGVGSLSAVWSLVMSSYGPLLNVLISLETMPTKYLCYRVDGIGRLWEWKKAKRGKVKSRCRCRRYIFGIIPYILFMDDLKTKNLSGYVPNFVGNCCTISAITSHKQLSSTEHGAQTPTMML